MFSSPILRPWLPNLVLEAAAGGPDLPVAPAARQCEGAAVFADVAGYTRLTAKLAGRGPVGAELVGELLNACFAPPIEEVARYGGDVLGFAGDAIIGFWHGESRRDVASRAKACAEAIQSRPFERLAHLPDEVIRMRVGVGAGPSWVMRVGGSGGAWILMAAGAPFQQMGPAARQAGIGSLKLSPEAESAIGTDLSPVLRMDGRACQDGPLDVDILRSFLPDTLLHRVAAGHSDWIDEHRTLSAVFCTMPAIDFSSAAERGRVQTFVESAQHAAARFEGAIPQVTVDDKGCVLIMAFGLPPRAHEDDALRAVSAAALLASTLERAELRHGVGVATGPAYCGGCGTARRRAYMVIGDAVNRAARLSQRGDAHVLCDQATREAIAGLPLVEVAPVAGAPTGQRTFRLLPDDLQRSSPVVVRRRGSEALVGRRQELALLHEALARVGADALRGGAVLVEGRAGAGKTSLIANAVATVPAAQLRAVHGAGRAIDSTDAYHGWRGVFDDLLNLRGATTDLKREQAIRRAVLDVTGSEALAPLLNGVVRTGLAENATTRQITGLVRGRTTLNLLVQILDHMSARQRLVVVLDDVHWFDGSSLDLASAVQRARLPLLMILIRRSEADWSTELVELWKELADHSDVWRLDVGGIDEEALRELLAQTLNVTHVPEDVVSMIASRAEGNPFFARELAYALCESGALQVDGRQCRLAIETVDRIQPTLPETVKSVVTQRLDRLSSKQLMTLKAGSVLGTSFSEVDLAAVYPIAEDRPNLRDHLNQMQERQLTRRASGSGDDWSFSHALIRDATYELIPQSQRRRLHRAAAEHLEETNDHGLLAYHWRVAGERERQLTCLEKAGAAAVAAGVNREAVSFFEQALTLDELAGRDDVRRGHWHSGLAEALYGLGRLGSSRTHLDEALRLFGEPLPRSTTHWVLRSTREIATQARVLVWGARRVSPGSATEERLRAAARLMSICAEQCYFSVDLQRMVVCLLSTINLAERTQVPEIASRAYGTLGYIVGLGRLHTLSRVYFRLGRRGLDAGAHVNTAVGCALYHLAFGRWAESLSCLEEGRTRAAEVGDMFGVGLCLNVEGDVRHLTGDLAGALQAYEALMANARARSNSQHEVWALSGCAETLLSQGRYDEASRRLTECGAVLPPIADRDRMSAFRHEGVKAIVRLRLHDEIGAAEALREALRLYRLDPTPMYATYWAVAGVVETALTLAQNGAEGTGLLPPVRDARVVMRRFARVFPIARARAGLLRGLETWGEGRQALARHCWRSSLNTAEARGMRHEATLARMALGLPPVDGGSVGPPSPSGDETAAG